MDVIAALDSSRRSMGFLTLSEMLAQFGEDVRMPDPASVLVSPGTILESGVVLWPGTILQAVGRATIEIGAGTILFPGTRVVAVDGRIAIGAQAEIGEEGGFTLKAEAGSLITVGDGARLLGGGSLSGGNDIGRGGQILGPIRCQNCRLGAGATYRDPDPDERGGVLKGSGVARNVDVPQGSVIQAFGLFSEGTLRRQSYFHPK
ncbi:hypothetical protein [Microvirga rosea]|uniref:hypothetical protein n=1 Tax=Microvirga rosea TaxID=2715425 RepID=UPI001D09B117|nr:hypothetical protein [Microvirga rosea]MCB8820620.1 hypothetical protein [Microvirga rosea]